MEQPQDETFDPTLEDDENDEEKHRDWVMTCNNYTDDDIARFEKLMLLAKYSIYGKEIGKKGTPHLQCYLYFKNPRAFTPLKKAMPRAYIAPAKGNATQNEKYCSKDGDSKSRGTKPQQGKRTDLDDLKEQIMTGMKTVDEICVEQPTAFHQYGRTLDRLEAIALRKQYRTWMTKGIWITGPSGSGKSHMAFENYSPETHYIKDISEGSLKWWDGYKGQPIVIINEFRGQITFDQLCAIVDKWPHTVSWRSKESVPLLAKTVIITSIKRPEDVYVNQKDEPWRQFARRFEVIELKLDSTEQKCSEGNIIPLSQEEDDIFEENFGD